MLTALQQFPSAVDTDSEYGAVHGRQTGLPAAGSSGRKETAAAEKGRRSIAFPAVTVLCEVTGLVCEWQFDNTVRSYAVCYRRALSANFHGTD